MSRFFVGLPVISLFVNSDERRLRSLWRILMQLAIMLLVVALPLVGFTEVMTWLWKSGRLPLEQELFDKIMDIVAGSLLTGLVLASLALAARWLDHRKFVEFGFRLNALWWKQYGLGLALGVLLMALIFAVELLAGWVDVIGYGYTSTGTLPLWLAFLYPVVKALCVGVYEEAISRGYHVTNLKEGLCGVWGLNERSAFILALVLSSAFFGILHLRNPHASILSTATIAVIGALLGIAYMQTGQLAMSIGLHTAWNLAQGWVFGFPVSGDPEISSLIQISQHGPAWMTGGAFGPEGGLLGLAAAVLGIEMLVLARRKG